MNTECLPYSLRRLYGPVIILGLLLMSLVGSCTRRPDSRLVEIDSMMESHPDSAMMLLNEYRLSSASSAADSAYYGLLLTHARYKNFIDETDDSLISAASDHFLDQGDKERASRALFLRGMIQLNAQHLGEAAVSFMKGHDIAREGKCYMWEGQCAAGMVILYGKLMNSSEQINYARIEYDAFFNGGYQDWSNLAMLDILRGYNNIGKYDLAIVGATKLFNIANEVKDTMLMEEVLTLMGTSKYSKADFNGAIENYFAAYQLDPSVLDAKHMHNIVVSATEVQNDSLPDHIRNFINVIRLKKEVLTPFRKLAEQGMYKEAYYGLESYKDMQDSVLRVLLQNNVSESVEMYEDMKTEAISERQKTERLMWIFLFFSLVVFIIVSAWGIKKYLAQKNLERIRLEDSLENMRFDLASQMKHIEEIAEENRVINEKYGEISSYLRNSLLEKYRSANDLCDSYFQDRVLKPKKAKIEKDIQRLIKDFSNPDFISEIGTIVDMCMDGLYTSFVNDFPNLNDDSKRLFIFLTLGFSSRTLCVIFGIETSNLYNRKSRLKKMFVSSNAVRKEEYIKNVF